MAASDLDILTPGIDGLADVDLDALADSELHDSLVGLATVITRLEAELCRRLQRWDTRQIWANNGSKAPAARLARETHMPRPKAQRLVSRSRQLVSMPLTAQAYATGDICAEHVDLIATCNREWANANFADHEQLLVDNCRTPFFDVAARATDYWKQHADPDTADRDAADVHDSRHLSASKGWRGQLVIDGVLDPVSGEIVKTELDRLCEPMRLADLRDGVGRTAGQRRVDALVEMAMRSATAPADGLRPRPLFTVVIGIEPFTRLCETAAGTVIAPGALMPLLSDADIERIVYDPPNRKIEASHRRRFTGAMRRIIEVRDRHCQHDSGCDSPVTRCDVDHIVPWPETRLTCICNGQLLCTTHNRIIKNRRLPGKRQRTGDPLPAHPDQRVTCADGDASAAVAERAPPTAS